MRARHALSTSSLLAMLATALSLSGCGKNVTDAGDFFCFTNCSGTGGGGLGGLPSYKIMGFPYANLASDGWGQLAPGESVDLYLYGGPSNNQAVVLVVDWTVSDPVVASVASGTGGQATVVAKASGTFTVGANGTTYMSTCDPYGGCTQVLGLRVVAPPAP
jgi:hypothetical protein